MVTFAALPTRTAVKTANYTAAPDNLVPVDTATPNANVTVTLPTAPPTNTRITVKHIAVGSGKSAIIACGAGDFFNKVSGPTSISLTLLNQSVTVQYDAPTKVWTALQDDISVLSAAYMSVVNAAGYCAFDGSDETTALTSALAAAAGGTLAIPRGKTVKTQTISPAANTTITGGGTIDLIDDGTGTSRSVFVNGVDGVTLDDVTITSSNAASRTGVYGLVRAANATNLKITRCRFGKSSSVAIYLAQTVGFTITDNVVTGPTYADGIHISRGSSRGVIRGNRVTNTQDDMIAVNSVTSDGGGSYAACSSIEIANNVCYANTTLGNGIAVYGGTSIDVSNNVVDSPVTTGIAVTTISDGNHAICTSVKVDGNTVKGVSGAHFSIWANGVTGAHFSRIAVVNNSVDSSGSTSDAIHASFCDNSQFSGNTVYLPNQNVNGVYVTGSSHTTMNDNNVSAAGTTPTGVYFNASADCIASGNNVTGCAVGGWEDGGGGPNLWIGNDFRGNTAFSLGGTPTSTTTIRSTLGYNPKGSQTVAVPATGVPVAVAPYDRTFYITAGASTVSISVGGVSVLTIPASGVAAIRVPAATAMTPAYSTAPTWVVYGD